ncbi:hypothetical protein PSCICF_20920 [Pseudomonas cichorii]|nr:hypothetical protein PSCICF_20920 [Pseudomonas cichorii]GFM60157.1 hypothetical protein PSCICG_13170 [Pseudomonas cichorii]
MLRLMLRAGLAKLLRKSPEAEECERIALRGRLVCPSDRGGRVPLGLAGAIDPAMLG